jgi:hypothetical protein
MSLDNLFNLNIALYNLKTRMLKLVVLLNQYFPPVLHFNQIMLGAW